LKRRYLIDNKYNCFSLCKDNLINNNSFVLKLACNCPDDRIYSIFANIFENKYFQKFVADLDLV